MELLVRVKQIFATRTGVSQTTGNSWAITPVLFEELNSDRPQSLLLEVFGDYQQNCLSAGMIGKVRFSAYTQLSKDGKLYNRLRFVRFEQLKSEPEEQQSVQG